MKLGVVGVGYVGLVAGACLADGGNHVVCVDSDRKKIDKLLKGEVPIYEPGLGEIVERNVRAKRLRFTTDLADAVENSLLLFLAVGTPAAADGSSDLSAVLGLAREIGRLMDGYRILVMKSTVPVGTHEKVSEVVAGETVHPFDFSCGEVGEKQLNALENILGNPSTYDFKKILFFHHHPFMHNNPFMELNDAVDLFRMVYQKIDLMLFGHKHESIRWKNRNGIPHILAADNSPSKDYARSIGIAGDDVTIIDVPIKEGIPLIH